MEAVARTQPVDLQAKTAKLRGMTERQRQQLHRLKQVQENLKSQPDGQLSMTDLHARSHGYQRQGLKRGGYKVHASVAAQHHSIFAHESLPRLATPNGCPA